MRVIKQARKKTKAPPPPHPRLFSHSSSVCYYETFKRCSKHRGNRYVMFDFFPITCTHLHSTATRHSTSDLKLLLPGLRGFTSETGYCVFCWWKAKCSVRNNNGKWRQHYICLEDRLAFLFLMNYFTEIPWRSG